MPDPKIAAVIEIAHAYEHRRIDIHAARGRMVVAIAGMDETSFYRLCNVLTAGAVQEGEG
jgi:hypothetical protein